jgi:hypothetical protein
MVIQVPDLMHCKGNRVVTHAVIAHWTFIKFAQQLSVQPSLPYFINTHSLVPEMKYTDGWTDR